MTRSLSEWQRLLKKNWEDRAALPSRDLFVASHPGWNDPEAWEKHARTELDLFLAGLDADWLPTVDALEIGCGSGRLARMVRETCRSYTGFDIASGMVEAARRRCEGVEGVEFHVGDGTSLPPAVQGRRFGLVLAVAVFIHCPREVIAANVQAAFEVLQPGGQLRFSVRAFPDDHEGIVVSQEKIERAAEALKDDAQRVIDGLSDEERKLAFDTYYMGDQFRYAEMEPFLKELTGGEVQLYRGDPGAIYAAVKKVEPGAED